MSVRRIQRRLKSGKLHVRWVIDIGFRRGDGALTRIRKVPRVLTRVAAERLEREILTRLEAKERAGATPGCSDCRQPIPPPIPPVPSMPTLRAFWRDFFSTYVAANNKPSEQAAKKSIFGIHLDPNFGHLRLDAIGGREIEQFKANKLLGKDRKYSAKSINN